MDIIGKDDVYQAERILDTKRVKGKRFFLIKWAGWDDSNNTWEPQRNIIDKQLIDIFFKSRKSSEDDKPKPKTSDTSLDKDKSKSSNTKLKNVNEEKVDDMRSVIRVAEGLRPLVKPSGSPAATSSSQQAVNVTDTVKSAKIEKKQNLFSSRYSTTSTGSSSQSSRSNKSLKMRRQPRSVHLSSTVSSRAMRRRKISSSSSSFNSSTCSSVIPLKRRFLSANKNRQSIKIDCTDEDEEECEMDNKNNDKTLAESKCALTPKQTDYRTKESPIEDNLTHEEDLNSSFDDYSLVGYGEDVFVTDITSGVITVTIKECTSPDGFFKSRDNKILVKT